MATITTVTSGSYNWSDTAAWVGGVLPDLALDTAVIAGSAIITISDSRTIPATTVGAAPNGTAQLLIANGITATAGGTLILSSFNDHNSKLILGAGSTLDMQGYNLQQGGNETYSVTSRFDVIANGTAGARATITGTGRIIIGATSAAFVRGMWDLNYCDVVGFGGGANNLALYHGVNLNHTLFKCTSALTLGDVSALGKIALASNINVANTDFRSSAAIGICLVAGTPTGTRNWSNSTVAFTGATTAAPPAFTVSGDAAYGGYLTGSGNTFYHYRIVETNARGNTFLGGSAIYIGPHSDVNSETVSLNGGGSELDASLIVSENQNNHGLQGGTGTTVTGINTLKNSVVENVYNTDTANMWIPALHAGSAVYNNLFIGSGFQSITTGLKGSKTAASSAQHDYYNNTFAGLGSGLYWEHGTAGTPQNGTTNYKNNLHVAQLTGTMAMVDGNVGPSADIADYLDNNAFFAGTSGNANYHAIAVSNWTEETRGALAYVSATSFTVAGVDLTTTYTAGKVLSIRLGTQKAWVKCDATTPSTFSGGNTTVTLDATFGALTAGLTQVYYQSSLKTLGTDAGAGGSDLVDVDPQFVDATRTVASYTGTTRAALFEELAKNNGFDIAGNPASRSNAWSVSDAIAYIKAGFTPTNMTLATAGEGGTYIGAVEPVASGDPQTITFGALSLQLTI